MRALRPGYELITIFYGDGADLAEAEAMARKIGTVVPGRRGRGPARRPALLPVPDLGRVGGRWRGPRPRPKATGSPPPPTDPVELLRHAARAIGPGGRRPAPARRDPARLATRSATCCSTCRAATTTCARCAARRPRTGEDGDGRVGAGRGRRRPGRGDASGGRVQRTIAAPRGRDGHDRGDVVRPAVHRAAAAGRRRGRRVRAGSSTSGGS